LERLKEDIKLNFELIQKLGLNVKTIYIGGGTPTILDERQLYDLLSTICKYTDTSALEEFTLEAGRPDTITEEKLSIAKKYGITRVSVNPQTLNDEILKKIGRKHTAADFFKAYEIAKGSGIRDINVDLIAGLPGDDFESFSNSLDNVIALNPSNITVHTFCVKKASDALRNDSSIYSLSGGDAAKCISYSQINTKFAQYKPYYMYRQKNTVGNLENVGFAKDGCEGRYNVYMMEDIQTIFGVGAGAVTKLVLGTGNDRKIKRIFMEKYPYEYLRSFKERKESYHEGDYLFLNETRDFLFN
jgi:oxygen-independent coproporphyrinogen-3 oxidase